MYHAPTRSRFLGLMMVLFAASVMARANVGLLVEEPYGQLGAFSPTGHATIYLNRVCAETPTLLRRCRPGESGAVLSRYYRLGGYDWLAVPLLPYLYAVERPDEIPAYADRELVRTLRDNYRRKNLLQLAPDHEPGKIPDGSWSQLVGEAYDRRMYGFEMKTTEEQDDELIRRLNAGHNSGHFNFFFHNCADFARSILDFYFPHVIRRNFIADWGLTTPKHLAKTLVKYGRHHDDVDLIAFTIPQVPGTLRRSSRVNGVAEALLKSKKYVVPLAFFHPYFMCGVVVAYLADGRFEPPHDALVFDAMRQVEPGQIDGEGADVPTYNQEK